MQLLLKQEIKTPKLQLSNSLSELNALPYKREPYFHRNWGHSLHFLCSYQSKLKPSIAHYLIRLFTSPGDKVLDPFAGVGTIPLEACLQGRIGIGIDINPVAYHNTNAKVNPPTLSKVLRQINVLEDYIEDSELKEDALKSVDDFTKRFYHEKTLIEILKAKQYFIEHKNEDGNLSFIISCLLHVLHGNRPYALSRRSHGLTPLTPTGDFIYKSLIKSLTDKARRALKSRLPVDFVDGKAYQASVFDMPIENESIDAIITSPPFLNSTRFFANNRIRLWFCGWDYQEQNRTSKQFLENLQVEDIKVYLKVFNEFNRVLRDDGLCILHLGVVKNRDMAKELAPVAEEKGFSCIKTVYEDTNNMESHGMTDQGVTHKHAFLILRKRYHRG